MKVLADVPDCVYPPVLVMPTTAAMAPLEFTWKRSPLPTTNILAGDVSPMPTFPEFTITLPLLSIMKFVAVDDPTLKRF